VETNSLVKIDATKELKSKSTTSAGESKEKSTKLSYVKCYSCGERDHTCLANPTKGNMCSVGKYVL